MELTFIVSDTSCVKPTHNLPIMKTIYPASLPRRNESPSLYGRIQSLLIDAVFVFLFLSVYSFLTGFHHHASWSQLVLYYLCLWSIYESICLAAACTAGNYVSNFRVKDARQPGDRIGIYQAFARFVLKLATGWLSLALMLLLGKKRALHDLIMGSTVITKPLTSESRRVPAITRTLKNEQAKTASLSMSPEKLKAVL
jgi:uncharacterized RDD family membrane protein YckC